MPLFEKEIQILLAIQIEFIQKGNCFICKMEFSDWEECLYIYCIICIAEYF